MTTKAPTVIESAALEYRNALVELKMWQDAAKRTPNDSNVVRQIRFAHAAAERALQAYGAAVRSELEVNASWYKQM